MSDEPFLHNIGDIDSENANSPTDSHVADNGMRFDYVLTNPPLVRKAALHLQMRRVNRKRRILPITVRIFGTQQATSN